MGKKKRHNSSKKFANAKRNWKHNTSVYRSLKNKIVIKEGA